MTVLKKYNSGTGQWETVIQGDQGVSAPSGGTEKDILLKNSSSNYDDSWTRMQTRGGGARMAGRGTYFDGSIGLVSEGRITNYVLLPNINATLTTWSLTVRMNITSLQDEFGQIKCIMNRGYSIILYVSWFGSPRLEWIDGTATGRALGFSALDTTSGTRWYRFTLNATGPDTVATIEVAPDSATEPTSWTLHNTQTASGLTGITITTSSSIFVPQIGTWAMFNHPFRGTMSRFIERHNGVVHVDANFSAVQAGSLAMTESSANAYTLSLNTSKYSYGIPSSPYGGMTGVSTTAAAANRVIYTPITITEPITIDMVQFEITATPATSTNARFGLYAVDGEMQPSGSPIFDTQVTGITTATTYYKLLTTPVTVNPGTYLATSNRSSALTYRTFVNSASNIPYYGTTIAASSYFFQDQAYQAFTDPGIKWRSIDVSTTGVRHLFRFRWSPA